MRLADPAFENRLLEVAALRMLALPFRPPAAEVTALAGRFEFNDDSLWWKDARANMPKSVMRGDGTYVISNGDMRLTLAGEPASFNDFRFLYPHVPETGGGRLALGVQWRGATQDYVMRNADLRTGDAHILGDIGVTMTDTIFFHDANLRFTGVTTKLIKEVAPAVKPPREGVLEGRAKFSGTPKRMLLDADVKFAAYNRGTSHIVTDGTLGISGTPTVVSANDLNVRVAPLQVDIVKLLFPTLPIGGTLSGSDDAERLRRDAARRVESRHRSSRTGPTARTRPAAPHSTRPAGRRWTWTCRCVPSRSPSSPGSSLRFR